MTKLKPRVDFVTKDFDLLIKSHGYAFKWSRSIPCPCENNLDTDQPDVDCAVCSGVGVIYFNPIDPSNAIDYTAIRGIVSDVTREPQVFEQFGQWIMGVSQITVEATNVISYNDRLIAIDAVMPHYQVVDADGSKIIKQGRGKERLRYVPLEVNLIRSLAKIYQKDVDFIVNSSGQIEWQITTVPPAGTILSVHYNYHPVYIVQQHKHVFRDTETDFKVQGQQHVKMPIQAMIKLAFLTSEN